jgi:hypothetical protein
VDYDAYKAEYIRRDAKDRAWRTFLQNIWVDLAVVVGPILVEAVTKWDGAFSGTYWQTVATTVAKTTVLVVLAYWMRMKKPPVTR